jgi:hypothetical protein
VPNEEPIVKEEAPVFEEKKEIYEEEIKEPETFTGGYENEEKKDL